MRHMTPKVQQIYTAIEYVQHDEHTLIPLAVPYTYTSHVTLIPQKSLRQNNASKNVNYDVILRINKAC
jgi:hypothetical protein